jgi:hypothetical protein
MLRVDAPSPRVDARPSPIELAKVKQWGRQLDFSADEYHQSDQAGLQ